MFLTLLFFLRLLFCLRTLNLIQDGSSGGARLLITRARLVFVLCLALVLLFRGLLLFFIFLRLLLWFLTFPHLFLLACWLYFLEFLFCLYFGRL
jgi:hypothetical protein